MDVGERHAGGRPPIGGQVKVNLGESRLDHLNRMVTLAKEVPGWDVDRATLLRRLIDLGLARAAELGWPGAAEPSEFSEDEEVPPSD